MKKFEIIPIAAAALMLTASIASCEKQESVATLDGKYIYLNVETENATDTKSAEDIQNAETVELSQDGQSLFITTSKTINCDNPFEQQVETKGAEKTAADVTEGFTMHMISDASKSLYKSGTVKQLGDRKIYPYWSFYDSSDNKIDWPEDSETSGATYSFVSCISADNVTVSGYDFANNTVNYTGMAHTSGTANDAALSQDLLLAYTANMAHDHQAQNQVNLHFYHPLAAVKFFVSEKVKRIAVSSAISGTMKYNATDDFTKAFTWTVPTDDDNIDTYYQEVNSSEIDATTGYAVYEFFLVPVNFANNEVKLTFDIEGTDGKIHQISTLANNLGTSSWDSGYRYNYYINEASVRKLGLEVQEEFIDYVKTNVCVANVMRSTAYVRATVVGNWVSEKGKIISSFEGDVNYNVGGSSNWVLGDDGFYYYKKPIVGYSVSEPLIKSFQDTAKSADLNFQLSNYHLSWQILVEGVEYNRDKTYVKEAWSDVTVGGEPLASVLVLDDVD